MEDTSRACPLCGEAMAEVDDHFTCAEHGDWFSYSANLLVRAPGAEAKASERVLMPWETLLHPAPSGT